MLFFEGVKLFLRLSRRCALDGLLSYSKIKINTLPDMPLKFSYNHIAHVQINAVSLVGASGLVALEN